LRLQQLPVDVVGGRVQTPVLPVQVDDRAPGLYLEVVRRHPIPQREGEPRAQVGVVVEGADQHQLAPRGEAVAEERILEQRAGMKREGVAALGKGERGVAADLRLQRVAAAPVHEPRQLITVLFRQGGREEEVEDRQSIFFRGEPTGRERLAPWQGVIPAVHGLAGAKHPADQPCQQPARAAPPAPSHAFPPRSERNHWR
jgi:hypothetical protein